MTAYTRPSGTNSVIIHDASRGRWLSFRDPVEVVIIDRLQGVLPSVRLVNQATNSGYWAAGFIAYEAAPAFDDALVTRPHGSLPLVWFGIYEEAEEIHLDTLESTNQPLDWTPSVSPEEYREAIRRVREYIAAGDTYQVNYTYRLNAPFTGDPWPMFVDLVRAQDAGFGAYVDTGDWAICSASPELFYDRKGHILGSRPMKGTAPRGLMLADDREQAEWLWHSEKNRAENVMIVDMVRNDLGRVARTGSVEVTDLFSVEKYPTVWQMTSQVCAGSDAGLVDTMRALFPAASITGAPKARTMEIITELETRPRGIYTGSIGFVEPGGDAQFNVAIRTVAVDRKTGIAEYGVGGGIVWDSTDTGELEETHTKTAVLTRRIPAFSLLESLLWTPGDGYYLLERHLFRLGESAEYFSFRVDMDVVREELNALISDMNAPKKVRLLVSKSGEVILEHADLDESALQTRTACLSGAPVDSTDPFLYHKTTNRRVYDEARAECPECDEVILWNERGEVTELWTANIIVEMDGQLWTPPVSCGLLPGTMRAELLAENRVKERVVMVDDLPRCTRILLVNSVRKEREVFLRDCT